MPFDILISGGGIAGPSLAFWLTRHGHDVTIIEQARELRTGGQAVDFVVPRSQCSRRWACSTR
jgi:2-polyprenyl-6-methoxyphenol hydroxylase-like FAD-dependent oxidoreductase